MVHLLWSAGLVAILILIIPHSCAQTIGDGSNTEVDAIDSTRFSIGYNLDEKLHDHIVKKHRPPSENIGFTSPETAKNWSGYVTVRQHRHLWYTFFESRKAPKNDPLVIWLTGGPGCSSLIALFMENGPITIDSKDLSLSTNPFSWNSFANVLWVDQPVGTGFSYSSHSKEDEKDIGPLTELEISEDMYEFIQGFLQQYTKYARAPLFLTGESYGGHYLPSLGRRILVGNEEVKKSSSHSHGRASSTKGYRHLNLKGVAIGNGLVDPLTQYEFYAPFAREHGVVTEEQASTMQSLLPGCLDEIRRCSQDTSKGWQACLSAHVLCLYSEILPIAYSGVNVYDVRLKCGEEPLCYNFSHVDRFLAQSHIRHVLGVEHRGPWQSCNQRVNQNLALAGDWMLSFASDIPLLLESHIPVLIYAGDQDLICNADGNEAWVKRMKWPGQEQFHHQSKKNHTWKVDGLDAGEVTEHAGLTFLRVKDAGHMVPMDQPKRALDMLDHFLHGRSFSDDASGDTSAKEQ